MLNKFKKDSMNMRKTKDPLSNTLITVFSEARMIGKNDGNRELTENDLVRQIKKTVVNLNATIDLLNERGSDASRQTAEKDLLESYLPKQMTPEELLTVINDVLGGLDEVTPRAMGNVMQHLKANYDGLYDGKTTSGIVKSAIGSYQ